MQNITGNSLANNNHTSAFCKVALGEAPDGFPVQGHHLQEGGPGLVRLDMVAELSDEVAA